ncbi:hypothetical protein [Siphonobacter sp. SORGH_AS_1065]|uniref:hypothetical protein n=1 Tax=Siphonobacter sp. SORGH_AS_1065 TaxID=3041795 RepID=UPI002786E9EB|nr:hypothetical protein [Siphonobacter sp. SORGH_AS_1065]MDQ1088614.1 cell division protein FtsB [Siphonobacter sp. SORGH_AS_1065]
MTESKATVVSSILAGIFSLLSIILTFYLTKSEKANDELKNTTDTYKETNEKLLSSNQKLREINNQLKTKIDELIYEIERRNTLLNDKNSVPSQKVNEERSSLYTVQARNYTIEPVGDLSGSYSEQTVSFKFRIKSNKDYSISLQLQRLGLVGDDYNNYDAVYAAIANSVPVTSVRSSERIRLYDNVPFLGEIKFYVDKKIRYAKLINIEIDGEVIKYEGKNFPIKWY